MSYEVKRQDALATRTAGYADTLEEAQRGLIQAAMREVDLLVCRDKRNVCVVCSVASVLVVDLRLGRVITTYSYVAVESPYTNADDGDTATLAVIELVQPVPGRRWPS